MASIQQHLSSDVLALQKVKSLEKEQSDELDALSCALAETTSLEGGQITAVLKNLQQEAEDANRDRSIPWINLPAIKPLYLRVSCYLFLGLMGYSVFMSADVEQFQEESLYDHRLQNTKVDFRIGINNIGGFILGGPYLEHYKKHQRFPNQTEDLTHSRIPLNLGAANIVSDYQIIENGRVNITLTESFGYNRWLQLTPEITKKARWNSIGFNCTTNAEKHLLISNRSGWCTHSSNMLPPE